MLKIKEILQAKKKFDKNIVLHTPLEYNQSLSEKYGAKIYIKREDQQIVRSYKIRWAFNFINSLSLEDRKFGVVVASAGNHAQGIALTCNKLGVKWTIFMPQTTPSQKVRKTKKFGGEWIEVVLVWDTFDEAFYKSKEFCDKKGAIFVHPFDDLKVITGQATLWFEIIEDIPEDEINYLVLPIGGGGIASGVGTIFKELSPITKVIGVESSKSASMYESIKQKNVVELPSIWTFADGVAVKKPWKYCFQIASQVVDKFDIVDDGLTATTMLGLLDDQWIIVEPAGALSIAYLETIKDKIKWKTIVCVISGWNFDFSRLPEVEEKSLKYLDLKRYYVISFPQRPGALKEFLGVLGKGDDVVYFEYMKKTAKERGPALVGIQTDNSSNFQKIEKSMQKKSIVFEDITNKELYFDLLI